MKPNIFDILSADLAEARGKVGATREVRVAAFRACLIALSRRRITSEVAIKPITPGSKVIRTMPFLGFWDRISDDDLERLYDMLERYFERDRKGRFKV